MDLETTIAQLSLEELEKLLLDLEARNDIRQFKLVIELRGKYDLEFFTLFFFPHYARHCFNQFHRDYFADVKVGERKVRRARAAPRGSAKSTLVSLIKPIHDIAYHLERYIILLSNTEEQAVGKIKDIRFELLDNARLVAVFGDFFASKRVGQTQFVASNRGHETKLQAFGSGAEIRGVRHRDARPSKIIPDDSEHSEEVQNEALRRKHEDWYFQVVSELGDENTNIDFVGTILHKDSLLKKLLRNPAYDGKQYKSVIKWSEREDLWNDWRKIYTNLDNPNRGEESEAFYVGNERELLRGTEVLWPEKEPYLVLMKQLIEKGKRSFFKEKQGEPIGEEEGTFQSFHFYREVEEGIFIESSGKVLPWDEVKRITIGAIDPASGQTKPKKGKLPDFAAILIGYKHERSGRLFVHHDFTQRAVPTKFIAQIFDLYEAFEFEKFAVEINLFRNLLLPDIIEEKKKREAKLGKKLPISFYEVDQVENKNARITTLEPKVTHGRIVFNRALSQTFMHMMEDHPNADHDDGPDCLEILWNLAHNRYKPSALLLRPQSGH